MLAKAWGSTWAELAAKTVRGSQNTLLAATFVHLEDVSRRPHRDPGRMVELPKDRWKRLTPAERRVVVLVCEGLTNGEIGAKLFISPRTVQGHLKRVFRMIGVTSRTQLATRAVQEIDSLSEWAQEKAAFGADRARNAPSEGRGEAST